MRKMILIVAVLFTLTSCSCYDVIDNVWPVSSRGWAKSIVDRESGNDPGAQNPSSSAAGCFQLMKVHAWRFDATGTSWAQRYDPVANTLAALNLYNEAGTSPWRLR
jgi:hypothetical protein